MLSAEPFTVDGTLLASWASLKSCRPRDGEPPTDPPDGSAGSGAGGRNPAVDFHGARRSNQTHSSTTDPAARLARTGKGKDATRGLAGHLLMDNRPGLAVDGLLTQATATAEREAALAMLDRRPTRGQRVTLGADKNYDVRQFIAGCHTRRVTPPVAQHTSRRRSAIDGRTTRQVGDGLSQRVRKRVEESFGWVKTVGGGRKLRHLGVERNQCWAELTVAAYNLVRLIHLRPSTA